MQQDLLQVSKDAAYKAHSEGDPSIKKLLETLFPKEFVPAVRDWKSITSFTQVCEAMGEDPARFDIPETATIRQRGETLFAMLQLICECFRQGTVLDYADEDQSKHYPWGRFSAASGFSLAVVGYAYTATHVGARLSVDSREKAEHIWKHFNKIYQDYWQWK